MLGRKGRFLGQELLDHQFLHFALAFENLLLLGGYGFPARFRSSDQIDELAAQAVDFLAARFGALAKLGKPRLDLLKLGIGDADLAEDRAITFLVLTFFARQRLGDPGGHKGAVERHGQDYQKWFGKCPHDYSPSPFGADTSER